MQVSEIESLGGLELLRPDWTSLWERTPAAGPFQHPDWLLAWWRQFGSGELWVLAVRDRGVLVAVAPFYIYSDHSNRTRQLTLVGNGISDSCDILIDPDMPEAVQALTLRLISSRQHWRSYDFRDLPNDSTLLQIVQSNFGALVVEDTPCVTVALAGWCEQPDETLPARMMADLRRCRRRAEEHGAVRIELVSTRDISEALEQMFGMHAARWRALGQEGVLNGAELHAFHHEVAECFFKRKWLRLYRLFVGSRLVAATYGFSLRARAYYYIGGFDPAFANLSPGKMVLYQFISEAAVGGATEFDFLRGAEEYKYRWGGQRRSQFRAHSTTRFQGAAHAH